MRQLKLGWVGSGFIGQVAHLANYAELPDVDIVALAELRPKLGALACRKYGIQRYYSDHRELLDDPDIASRLIIEIIEIGFSFDYRNHAKLSKSIYNPLRTADTDSDTLNV